MEFPQDVLQSMQSCEEALLETVLAGKRVEFKELQATFLGITNRIQPPSCLQDKTFLEWQGRIQALFDSSCDDGHQIMRSCEEALRESVSIAGKLVDIESLRFTCAWIRRKILARSSLQDKGYLDWQARILDLLDLGFDRLLCEEITATNSTTTSVLELSPLLKAPFRLNPHDAALFHGVANLLSFKALLFCSRESALGPTDLRDQPGLQESLYVLFCQLPEKVSELSEKWNTKVLACGKLLDHWQKFFKDNRKLAPEAKKTLHRWTIPVVWSLLGGSGGVTIHWYDARGLYAEAAKMGNEVWEFLQDYNKYLKPVDDTVFLYHEFVTIFYRTALLCCKLGDFNRTIELGEFVLRMLEDLEDGDIMVTVAPISSDEVAYHYPQQFQRLVLVEPTLQILVQSMEARGDAGAQVYRDKLSEVCNEILESTRRFDSSAWPPELEEFPYQSLLLVLSKLLDKDKLTEAEKVFERYKEEKLVTNESLRMFLEGTFAWQKLRHPDLRSSSATQSYLRKLELLLSFSESVGDCALIADISWRYGDMLAKWSQEKLSSIGGFYRSEDAAFKRWLKEEMDLPFATPEDVLKLKLILKEPYSPGEHKKNLPPMLKACRLFRCFIDTYSDFLHNWTHGSANEAEWLQLLEKQKQAHGEFQKYLLMFAHLCFYSYGLETKRRVAAGSPLTVTGDHHIPISANNEAELNNVNSGFEKHNASAVLEIMKSTLVWAERNRARTLLHQLGPSYVGQSDHRRTQDGLRRELIDFDHNEEVAMTSITSCISACEAAVFVEYLLAEGPDAMAYVVSNRHGVVSRMIRRDDEKLLQLVDSFYKAVTPNEERKVKYDGRLVTGYLEDLYDLLIEPIWLTVAPALHPESTLVFVPDKILHRVPFALLRDRKKQKYLFELHPISVAPSLRVLQHCKKRLQYLDKCPMNPKQSILAVGGASYEVGSADALPGSAIEVEELAQRFPGRVYRLEKGDATRANLLKLLEECRVSEELEHAFGFIHLGVHCRWNDSTYPTGAIQFAKPSLMIGDLRTPIINCNLSSHDSLQTSQSHDSTTLESEVVAIASSSRDDHEVPGSVFGEVGCCVDVTRASTEFKSSKSESDMLRSEDIVANGIQWRTRLVVLSACNSSKGQVFSDGEVNLPRALMIAGVPATLVAQWKVVDRASPVVMRAFYASLHKGQNVATALQSSMKDALRVHGSDSASKIHEWGPFVVWGLPNVQLPEELWREDARNALAAKQEAEKLNLILNQGFFKEVVHFGNKKWDVYNPLMGDAKERILKALKVLNFIISASSDTGCITSEDELEPLTHDAVILAVLQLVLVSPDLNTGTKLFPLVEQVFMLVSLEDLEKVGLQLLHQGSHEILTLFWMCMKYTQAMHGSPQVALQYVDLLIKDQCTKATTSDWPKWLSPELARMKLERAVVLRLCRDRHEEALEELNAFLALGDDHEGLIQRSCVKHLMGDEHGALEDASHAQSCLHLASSGMFRVDEVPGAYRKWLFNATGRSCLPVKGVGTAAICNILSAVGVTGFKFEHIDMRDVETAIRSL